MRSFGIDCQGGKGSAGYAINCAPTLAAISHGTPHAVAYFEAGECNGDGGRSVESDLREDVRK